MSTTNTTLISITPKAEELISYCARVSNPANQDNPECEKLIKYLIKHNHWSPFELAHMVIEINTTRAIAAQILRHRSFSFQEFSQRYASVSDLLPPAIPDLRRQDLKNRQNSIDDLNPWDKQSLQLEIRDHFYESTKLYNRLLDKGIAKESARAVLPLNTPTRLYMAGSIRSWIHYIQLRSANGTQLEHQQIAEGCGDVLKECLPNIYMAVFNGDEQTTSGRPSSGSEG